MLDDVFFDRRSLKPCAASVSALGLPAVSFLVDAVCGADPVDVQPDPRSHACDQQVLEPAAFCHLVNAIGNAEGRSESRPCSPGTRGAA